MGGWFYKSSTNFRARHNDRPTRVRSQTNLRWPSSLTPKQRRFVAEYPVDLNATQGAMAADHATARTERAATDHPRAAGPRGDMVGVRQFTSQVVCVQWPQGQGFRGR